MLWSICLNFAVILLFPTWLHTVFVTVPIFNRNFIDLWPLVSIRKWKQHVIIMVSYKYLKKKKYIFHIVSNELYISQDISLFLACNLLFYVTVTVFIWNLFETQIYFLISGFYLPCFFFLSDFFPYFILWIYIFMSNKLMCYFEVIVDKNKQREIFVIIIICFSLEWIGK